MSWDGRAVPGVLGFLSLALDFRVSPPGPRALQSVAPRPRLKPVWYLVFSALPEQKPELNVYPRARGRLVYFNLVYLTLSPSRQP